MHSVTTKIRFKEFDDEYNPRKLIEVVDKLKSYSLSRDVETSESTGYKYIHYGDIHTKKANLIVDEQVLPNIKEGEYIPLEKGDLVIADASEDYQGIATPSLLLINPTQNIIAGLHTIALRVKTENSPLYLYYLLSSSAFKKYAYKAGTGTKVFGISYNNLVKFEFLSPSQNEQEKIGKIFKQLDDIIALKQQIIDQLEQYKKAMLQKMFPQKGERVPKVRFKGFKDDWENATLENIVENIGTGKSKYSIQSKSEQAPYEILGSTSIIGYDHCFDYDGDFILTARVGANAGTLYKYAGKVKITDNTVFIKSENLNFIYYLLVNFDLKKLAFGTGQPLIKSSELKKIELKKPIMKEEQEKIGTFFKQLDDTISLHQKKLEGYQNFKRTLLQRMFI